MKSKIVALMLGIGGVIVCAGFLTADDGGLPALDKADKNPREAIGGNIMNVAPPAASQGIAKQEAVDAAKKQAPLLVVMKELLKDIPAEDRAEFLNSMVLKNGRIVSAPIAPLERTLTKEKLDNIMKTIFYHPEGDADSSKTDGKPARFVEISKLLKDLSPDVRNEFLDSLTFKNGSFVSAYIGGLHREAKTARMREILKAIATTPGPVREFDLKTLCGDGVCYKAACTSVNDGPWHCAPHKKWSCDSSCSE